MPLAGPNLRAVVAEAEPLLGTGGHDVFQLLKRQRLLVLPEFPQQRGYVGPALLVEADTEVSGLVAQLEAEELAAAGRFFFREHWLLVSFQLVC